MCSSAPVSQNIMSGRANYVMIAACFLARYLPRRVNRRSRTLVAKINASSCIRWVCLSTVSRGGRVEVLIYGIGVNIRGRPRQLNILSAIKCTMASLLVREHLGTCSIGVFYLSHSPCPHDPIPPTQGPWTLRDPAHQRAWLVAALLPWEHDPVERWSTTHITSSAVLSQTRSDSHMTRQAPHR